MQSRPGHPRNFKLMSKFSYMRPVFPDYLSFSYDYGYKTYFGSEIIHFIPYKDLIEDVIFRRTGNSSFIFLFFLLFLFISVIASIQLLDRMLIRKSLRFDVKEARNIDKASSKTFSFKFERLLFILHKDFICTAVCFTVKKLFFSYFFRIYYVFQMYL